jgi:acetyl-CoA acetyltransferase
VQAVRLIEAGEAECVVAGGADSTSNAEVPLPRELTLALGKYSMGGGNKNGWRGLWEMLKAGAPFSS